MIQIQDSLAQKNFHKAISLLQKIQQNKSPLIKFIRDNILVTWVPKISKSLLEVEMLECDNFLMDIRRDSSTIGTILIRKQAYVILKRIHQYRSFVENVPSPSPSASPKATTATNYNNTLPNNNDDDIILPIISFSLSYIYRLKHVFRLQVWSIDTDFEKCIPVNYSQCQSSVLKNKESNDKKLNKYFDKAHSLYYAIHTFTALDSLNLFYDHYRSERQQELELKFEGARKSILKYGLYSSFVTLSAGLLGFFSIECMISRSLNLPSDGPFSVLEIRQAWSRTCVKLNALCMEYAETLTSVDDMLCLKDDLVSVYMSK